LNGDVAENMPFSFCMLAMVSACRTTSIMPRRCSMLMQL